MQTTIIPSKLDVIQSHMSFFLPFGFDARKKDRIIEALEEHGYPYFQLKKADEWGDIYGPGIQVGGKELEQYFYPYVEHKLFPLSIKDRGFHRFTKQFDTPFLFSIRDEQWHYIVRSVDIILGPFGLAFLTVRVESRESCADLADILEFMQHFRAIDTHLMETKGSHIILENGEALSIYNFLLETLCPFLKTYMISDKRLEGYFGSLPYFDDERMYASAFLFTKNGSEITEEQLFRMGNLNGRTPSGETFVSAHNPEYIRRSLAHTLHDRWSPHTYTVTTEHAYVTVTDQSPDAMQDELVHYMGTHYYNFIIHYFYRIMLLRVSYEYSEIVWSKDEEYVKSLIKLITLFSSWYYFREISTRSEGKELSLAFYKAFNIENLFNEVNLSLNELYKAQENSRAGRMNMLLFILTVFTVVSGIYGMNLVISDWEDPFGWKKYTSYTFFEWISLVTAVSGIGLSGYLIVSMLIKFILRKSRDKKSDLYM